MPISEWTNILTITLEIKAGKVKSMYEYVLFKLFDFYPFWTLSNKKSINVNPILEKAVTLRVMVIEIFSFDSFYNKYLNSFLEEPWAIDFLC